MKENIKFLLFVTAFLFFGCCPASARCSTISGPDAVKPGELATVECAEEGEWLVTPKKGVQFVKDTGGKALYFVGQREGDYTIIFFGVVNGKPLLLQKDITIGEPAPDPDPSPTPEPSPSPVQKLDDAARQALAESLTFTLDMIEKGRIRTVQGVRSTFKQSITSKAAVCDDTGCHLKPEVAEVLDAWTEETDFSTVESTKKAFQAYLKEVKEW